MSSTPSKNRATFATKTGAIAAAVGASVGFGNLWRFPYITGQDGGGAFLLIYLVTVSIFGLPLIVAEFTIGHSAHKNAVSSFKALAPKSPWWVTGVLGLLVACLITGFYVVLSGWTLCFTWRAITNHFAMGITDASQAATAMAAQFTELTTHPVKPLLWTALALFLNLIILSGGVRKGIERASTILMPILGVLLVLLVIYSMFLPGFGSGIKFLFCPDWSKVTGRVFIDAIGQAFFSLSIAMGISVVYGSYMDDQTNMVTTARNVAFWDTLIAILAGVVIFPACFSFGIEPGQGPGLIFVTLPTVFVQMPGGYIIGILFFLLVSLAGLTSCISLLEVPISFIQEKFGLSRKKSVFLCSFCMLVLACACSLSLGVLSEFRIMGDNLFDFLDHITSRYMMPLCAMLTAVFVGWVIDKKYLRNSLSEDNPKSNRLFRSFLWILRIVAPLGILLIFLNGIGVI